MWKTKECVWKDKQSFAFPTPFTGSNCFPFLLLLVQFLRNGGVESENPETEGELVLDLKVDPPREDGDQGGDAVQMDEGLMMAE